LFTDRERIDSQVNPFLIGSRFSNVTNDMGTSRRLCIPDYWCDLIDQAIRIRGVHIEVEVAKTKAITVKLADIGVIVKVAHQVILEGKSGRDLVFGTEVVV
jgi:hypothetical protein